MRKFVFLVLPLLIIGCAGQAMVEVGLNDEESLLLLLGTEGDLAMRLLCIEVPEGADYDTLWQGAKQIQVSINSSDFISITDAYEEISPGSYERMRLTVDSVRFVQEPIDEMLRETSCQFTAQAFSPIVIEEDDEIRLVVSINSDAWFDTDSLKIKEGHEPFEGARLKIYYEL